MLKKWVKGKNTKNIVVYRYELTHFVGFVEELENKYRWTAFSKNNVGKTFIYMQTGLEQELETAKFKAIESLENIINTTRQELGI
jgi:hypothetical protein